MTCRNCIQLSHLQIVCEIKYHLNLFLYNTIIIYVQECLCAQGAYFKIIVCNNIYSFVAN